jgi:hypothetical protein
VPYYCEVVYVEVSICSLVVRRRIVFGQDLLDTRLLTSGREDAGRSWCRARPRVSCNARVLHCPPIVLGNLHKKSCGLPHLCLEESNQGVDFWIGEYDEKEGKYWKGGTSGSRLTPEGLAAINTGGGTLSPEDVEPVQERVLFQFE